MPSPAHAPTTWFLITALALAPLGTVTSQPQWWIDRSVLDPQAGVNNFGPANIGQLKHVATMARDEFEARLPGGAGAAIDYIVDAWYDPSTGQPLPPNPPDQNLAPINLGQLKAVAKPFYLRLFEENLLPDGAYPWTADPTDDANFAPANIGQLKHVFSFDVVALVAASTLDTDGDGMPDAWENAHGFDPNDPNDANGDEDEDGLTNLEEFRHGLNPNNSDSDGDSIPDYLEAAEATGEMAKPGAGDENDPNDEPQTAFSPPHFVVLPLGGEFVLGSTGLSFPKAWITDTSSVLAVQETDEGARHFFWKEQATEELWPRLVNGEPDLPTARLIGASRAGQVLAEVTFEEGNPAEQRNEYRVVQESELEHFEERAAEDPPGAPLVAAMPDAEIKALTYYQERLADFIADSTNPEYVQEFNSQSVESVLQISESGNVVGRIVITVLLIEPPDPLLPFSYGHFEYFQMLLPFYWKTGAGAGITGSLHDYFTPDEHGRYWAEAGGGIDGPNFTLDYFGGLDTLVYSSLGGAPKIGVVWPGSNIPQGNLLQGFSPTDGSIWGSSVSAANTFAERSLSNTYSFSLLPTIPVPSPNPEFPAAGLTNTRWWNLANLARPADPANHLPAINGPAFVVKAPGGAGIRTWQAWPMEELVAGFSGTTAQWSGLAQKHMANTGAIVAQLTETANSRKQLAILLPVDLDVDNDGDLHGPADGLGRYLAGYEGTTATLHNGDDFEAANFKGAQAIRIVIEGIGTTAVDSAEFEIIDVSSYEGFCGNGLAPEVLGAGNTEDFSFSASVDLRTISGTIETNKIWVPLHCKDYGGWCTIQITFRKNGEVVGAPATLTIPHDNNGDHLADHWQDAEIVAWNTQFAASRPITQAERDEMQPNGEGVYPDTEEIDPDGAENGDGGRDLPAMAVAGDGLTILDEYRGYLFDGGVGITGFTHKRLSTARKELLVEARVETDLAAEANNGTETTETIIATNQAVLATFDEAATLEAVRDMYRHSTRGTAIDLYWAFVELNSEGPMITYAPDTFPARPAFRWNGEVRYRPDVAVMGAGLVYWDASYREQEQEDHDEIYGGPNPDSGLVHAMNRHPALGQFVKHLFVTRSGPLWFAGETQWLRANYEDHSIFKNELPFTNQGTRNDVASLADEGRGIYAIGRHFDAAEFEVLANVAAGHEIGHLFVDAWHEQPGAGTLMGDQQFPVVENGVLVRIDGLEDVEWSAEAIGRINLPERFSIE